MNVNCSRCGVLVTAIDIKVCVDVGFKSVYCRKCFSKGCERLLMVVMGKENNDASREETDSGR